MVSGEELVRRAAARMPWRDVMAGRPDGPGWFAVAPPEDLPADTWYRELLRDAGKGHRDVAGAYLANYLVEIIAAVTAAALVHDEATWAVRPDSFRVRRHGEGWFDALAIDTTDVWVVDGRCVRTEDDLFAAVADGLVAIAAPWFDTVRRLAPYGRFGMWGSLADGIASAAIEPVRLDPPAAARAWARAQHLIDHLAERVPSLRVRPRTRTIPWSGGQAWVTTQGTCCLYYKVHDPAGGGEQYCLGCPLRPEGESDPLYAAWLDREHGPAAAG